MSKAKKNDLPEELKELVSWSVSLLGKSIREEYGSELFGVIESTRRQMKNLRQQSAGDWKKSFSQLQKSYTKLEKLSPEERLIFAHANTCMLELINRCESAYRTFRLGQRNLSIRNKNEDNWIIFVLTAHPTEARAPEFLAVFDRIMDLLVESLWEGFSQVESEVFHLLRIILKVPIARQTQPRVFDEAQNIYNFALKAEILETIVKLRQQGTNVMFRTWVGGDKDGHPGVDENTMLDSFSLSRNHLLIYVKRKLHQILFELEVMKNLDDREQLMLNFEELQAYLDDLAELKPGDGLTVVSFRQAIVDFRLRYEKAAGLTAIALQDVIDLIWLFPALVLPLEIREDSEIVHASLANPNDFAIGRMLKNLCEISRGNEAKWYARGFVLSMCESVKDIEAGIALSKKTLGGHTLPVVPLFETEKALAGSKDILLDLFAAHPEVKKLHLAKWGGRFEVMLGYSDSAKESGVFASRLLISQALLAVDKVVTKNGLRPVFFHGSGGSVERGGGSIQEQTEWWPKSAISIFKATVQGEMVARSFASPEIFAGQIERISQQWKVKRALEKKSSLAVVEEFSRRVQRCYQETIADPEFLKVVEKASPYLFLSHLKIGSRPSKRTSELKVGGLRAIPWILCWTQTRVLFPTWWGTGSAWQNFTSQQRTEFKKQYRRSKLLSSYFKLLGFTLKKVELSIWKLYLQKTDLPEPLKEKVFNSFVTEYELALRFFNEVTGKKDLLWHRPWLGRSIELRSPMIHPLNLLQLMAVKDGDMSLLRKTVTGIACGMLTTG